MGGQALVRFFDEAGQPCGSRRFTDEAAAQECAAALLGMETDSGGTVALVRFYVAAGAGGWIATGEEMEF